MSAPENDLTILINANQELQRGVEELRIAIQQLCSIIVDQERYIQFLGLRYDLLLKQQAGDDE